MSESRAEYYSSRIVHFLKGYRSKHNLTQEQLAKKVHTTKSTISRIENQQEKQVANMLEVLESLAQLEGMKLGQFLDYLANESTPESSDDLFPWQKSLLQAMRPIKQSVRLNLVSKVLGQEPQKIEQYFGLLIEIASLSPSRVGLLEILVKELKES